MTAVDTVPVPDFVASLREARMVTERLLQWQGFAAGRRPALTEAGVYSAALGLSGFEGLLDTLETLKTGIDLASTVTGTGTTLEMNARGKHAWAVAEEVSDLLANAGRRLGAARITVRNLAAPDELAVVAALIEKHGLAARITVEGADAALVELVLPDAPWESRLMRICKDGIPVDRSLWFDLFHASNNAQAPDTKRSRMHTGSVVLDDQGRIVGGSDDEALDMDISLLVDEVIAEPGMEEGQK